MRIQSAHREWIKNFIYDLANPNLWSCKDIVVGKV
jgi:hypothetical protein